jgi:hypothetical protein
MREWRFRIVTQDGCEMNNFPYVLGRYLQVDTRHIQKRLSRGAFPERQLKFFGPCEVSFR